MFWNLGRKKSSFMNFDFMIFGAKLVSKPLGLCPRLQNVAFLETIVILRKGVLILQACFVHSQPLFATTLSALPSLHFNLLVCWVGIV